MSVEIFFGFSNRFIVSGFLVMNSHFQFVKAESINTVDVALRDDGLAVGLLDDAEDVHTLVLAAHDQDNLHVSLGVPALAVKDSAAAMGNSNDVVGYLLPLLADDEELDTLARVVDHSVGHYRVDDHEDKTINNLINRVEQQPRRADDEHIAVHHRAAK